MKKIMFFLLAALCLTTACSKYDNMVYENIAATLYFSQPGIVEVTDTDAEISLCVVKGGNASYDVDLCVGVATQALVSHNIASGDNFQLLPEQCYALSATKSTLSAEHYLAYFTLTFDAEQLNLLPKGKYALPIGITSDNAYIGSTNGSIVYCFDIK